MPIQLASFHTNYEFKSIQILANQPGVDFNVKDKKNINLLHFSKGKSPLFTAIECQNLTVSKILLNSGSHVNTKDNMGRSILKYTIENDLGFEYVQFLLYAGAKIGELSENSVLSIAFKNLLDSDTNEKQKIMMKSKF